MQRTKATAVIAALLLGSCTSPRSTGEPQRVQAINDTPCPDAFVAPQGGTVRCGFLTVPEDRSEPNGRTIRLFFSRWTPQGDLLPDPILDIDYLVLSFGEGTRGYDWLHRETFILDERGTERSEPVLDCSELDEIASTSLSAPSDDPEWRGSFRDAVRHCHDRLVDRGIDLAAYDLQEMAADAEDLRVALGVGEWNLRGLGSGARLALEIIRRYPEHIRATWLDTPELPQVDGLTGAILSTRYAMRQISRACAEDPQCESAFPDVRHDIASALSRYARHPVKLAGRGDGGEVPILLDGGLFLRAFREVLTYWPEFAPAAAVASPSALVEYGSTGLINDTAPFTYGYVPGDEAHFTFAHGAFLSSFCRDQLAFTTQAHLVALADGDPAYEQAFARTPFFEACTIWDVGSADPEVHEPVTSDVPTLLLVGRFGPYAPRPVIEEAARTLSTSWIVEFPNEGHNVLSDECAVDLRNTWIEDPASPPDTSCVGDLGSPTFTLPL